MFIVKFAKLWLILGLILVIASFISIGVYGLKFGIDFTGGSVMEVSFNSLKPTPEQVAETLKPLNVGKINVTPTAEGLYLIKTTTLSEDQHQQALTLLKDSFKGSQDDGSSIVEKRFNSVGPTIGKELRQKSIIAIGTVILAIILFITYIFRRVSYPISSFKYGLAAIIALIHDIIIPTGIFAYLGHLGKTEIDILFVIALLSILGSSINDTIVVFDRIRENLRRYGGDNFKDIVVQSINQTLVRSFNSSFTIIIVLTSIVLFGGESIKYFALALLLGTVFGTYSSIFIASPLLLLFHDLQQKKEDKIAHSNRSIIKKTK